MFDLGIVSVRTWRARAQVRFCFRCGCRAVLDLVSELWSELQFCRKSTCPSSQFERQVVDEWIEEQRTGGLIAKPDSELVQLVTASRRY